MTEEEHQPRATLPEPDRTTAERNAYRLDDDLLNAGVKAARKQFFADEDPFSPLDDAFDHLPGGAFDENDMLRHAQAPLQKMLQGLDLGNLSGLLDNVELVETMIRLWSGQTKMWGEFLNEVYGLGNQDPDQAFADITGIHPGKQAGSKMGSVVISNHPVEVDVYWNSSVPNSQLQVAGLLPIGQKRKTAPKGLEINIRRSIDGLTQVVDVHAPDNIGKGNYAGIIVSDDGQDHGHLSLRFSAD